MRERRTDIKGRRKTSGNWGEDQNPQTTTQSQSLFLLHTFILTLNTLEENNILRKRLEGLEELQAENNALKAQLFEKVDHTFTKRFAVFILFLAFVVPVLLGLGYEIFQYTIHNLNLTLVQATARIFSKYTP